MTMRKHKNFWERREIAQRFYDASPSVPFSAFLGRLPQRKGLRILDLGCGGGRNTKLMHSLGFDVYACDASKTMVATAKHSLAAAYGNRLRGRVILATMVKLPYRQAFFDVVVSNGVFHNARSRIELGAAIRETRRVLRQGGVLYVNMFYFKRSLSGVYRTRGVEPLYRTRQGAHMVLLPRHDLIALLRFNGFSPRGRIASYRKKLFTGERNLISGAFVKCKG